MHVTYFEEFCTYMESFTNLEKQNSSYSVRLYRLDRMKALMSHIGNPEKSYRCVHVAGSKGKGSTASFIAKGIQAAGFKTGLYMSPHLHDYRERFTIAGTIVADRDLVNAANILLSRLEGFHFEDEWGSADPTAFELYTSYAFLLFETLECQWAVIETGLGGRLDATNVVIPEVSVLTPIELEHTAILGDTISLIASEKAKIIKKRVPVCISYQKEEARAVFIQEAIAQEAPVYELANEVESIQTRTTKEGELTHIRWKSHEETSLQLSMLGEVQAENSALALLVLKTLDLYLPQITESALQLNTLPGRMQQVSRNPAIYIDGAHTVQSITHLVHSFSQMYGIEGNTLIYGALVDKDHVHMIEQLIPIFDHIIVSQPGTFKKSNPEALYLLFKEHLGTALRPRIFLEKNPDKALTLALSLTAKDRAILCTGSFYLGGEIVGAYERMEEMTKEAVSCP